MVQPVEEDQDLGLKQVFMGPTEEYLYWSMWLISRVSFCDSWSSVLVLWEVFCFFFWSDMR